MSDAVDALKTATNQIFEVHFNAWREIVTGLDAAALNWKPGDETNSIAVLVAHACDATRFLMASAAGIELDRDREAKFRIVASSAEEMLELINKSERDVGAYTDQITADLLVAGHARPGRTHTGAWWLLHAVEHNREHIGQALLTRQLYEQH